MYYFLFYSSKLTKLSTAFFFTQHKLFLIILSDVLKAMISLYDT